MWVRDQLGSVSGRLSSDVRFQDLTLLFRKQGLDQLLDLAERLEQTPLPCEIVIRGDGNYRAELQRRAQDRNVGTLRFEPLLPVDKLSWGLSQGHIHLVPQDPAGAAFAVPSKIYSIMAAGRPFDCTANPGSPMDRLRQDSDAGLTCPPDNPDRLADAVQCLLENPVERTRLGLNGRAYVVQHAGKAACARAYRALLLADKAPNRITTPNCM